VPPMQYSRISRMALRPPLHQTRGEHITGETDITPALLK